MPTTSNMNLILPEEGGSADVWDTLLNDVFELIDQHDHTTGKGARIPSAALRINADVSWASLGTNYSITDTKALDFAPQAAADVAGYASALFVSSADNNLYFRNSLGTNVKVTDGSTLNVSIVGGIGGDYSTVGALVDYDDANDTYRFRQETALSVRQYAKVATADLILREYIAAGGAVPPVNTVTVKSPSALAGSYALTMLAALPAATQPLTVSATGQVEHGVSFAMDADAGITFSGTGGADITGTGNYKISERSIPMALEASRANVATGTVGSTAGTPGVTLGNNTIAYFQLPPLKSYERIVRVTVWFPDGTSRSDVTCELYQTSSADPALRAFTSTGIFVSSTTGSAQKTTTCALSPSNSRTFWLQVSNSANTPAISAITVGVDVPT